MLHKFNVRELNFMKKAIKSAFVLAVLFLIAGSQPLRAQIAQKRQSRLYSNGGQFDFNWGTSLRERERMSTKIIDFLSANLSRKKLARLVMYSPFTLHGDVIESAFYVEPDRTGRWLITEEWRSSCCVMYALEKKQRKPITKSGKKIHESIDVVKTVVMKKATLSF